MKAVSELTLADVKRVYSGKAGECTCGCKGTWRFNEEKFPSVLARKVLKLMQANIVDVRMENEKHFWIEKDGRLYMLFLV